MISHSDDIYQHFLNFSSTYMCNYYFRIPVMELLARWISNYAQRFTYRDDRHIFIFKGKKDESQCLPRSGWLNKLWYVLTMGFKMFSEQISWFEGNAPNTLSGQRINIVDVLSAPISLIPIRIPWESCSNADSDSAGLWQGWRSCF
jgi:hypothetical protein